MKGKIIFLIITISLITIALISFSAQAAEVTHKAEQVEPGAFSADTGQGNYSFPGKLGIGTANPAVALVVNGTVNINNTIISTKGGNWKSKEVEYPARFFTRTPIQSINTSTIYLSYIDLHPNDTLLFANSNDTGINWNIRTVDNNSSFDPDLHAPTPNTIFITYRRLLATLDLKFAKSTNAGRTWQTKIIAPNGTEPSIHAPNTSTIFIAYIFGGTLKLANSTNAGLTWNTKNISAINESVDDETLHSPSLDAPNSTSIFISYFNESESGGRGVEGSGNLRFAKSTDAGSTWTLSFIDRDDADAKRIGETHSLDAIDTNTVFVSYTNGSDILFAKSTDAGSTWSKTRVDKDILNPRVSISATDANNIFIAFFGVGNISVASSKDGGVTWTSEMAVNLKSSLSSIGLHALTPDALFLSYNNRSSATLTNNASVNFAKLINNINIGIGTASAAEKLEVTGNILKTGTLSFVQEHPFDPAKQIVYVALEGPEAGTYIRGTASCKNKIAAIKFSEHFTLVTSKDRLTARLTPRSKPNDLFIKKLTNEMLIVACSEDGEFDYLVNGIRIGYENYQPIKDK